jgi:hypothetical protein
MWYSRVVASLRSIPNFIAHYERELDNAKKDCRIGGLVEKNITALAVESTHTQKSNLKKFINEFASRTRCVPCSFCNVIT